MTTLPLNNTDLGKHKFIASHQYAKYKLMTHNKHDTPKSSLQLDGRICFPPVFLCLKHIS